MRFVMTLFLWVLTTILLAAAVPSAWVQKNIIDQQGYSGFNIPKPPGAPPASK